MRQLGDWEGHKMMTSCTLNFIYNRNPCEGVHYYIKMELYLSKNLQKYKIIRNSTKSLINLKLRSCHSPLVDFSRKLSLDLKEKIKILLFTLFMSKIQLPRVSLNALSVLYRQGFKTCLPFSKKQ